MHRSFQILLLLAAAPMLTASPALAQMRPVTVSSALGVTIPGRDGIVLIGGMNGDMSAGGMNGGMSAGGMNGGMSTGGMNGGMSAGGMNGGMSTGGMNGGMSTGGMGGMTGGGMGAGTAGAGVGGAGGGLPDYRGSPAGGMGQFYGGDATMNGSSPAHYQCVTQQGHCSVEATAGSLRHGASCSCLLGGPGKIK